MTTTAWDRVPIEPQSVEAPLSRSAVFLTLAILPGDDNLATVRAVLGDLGGYVRAVGFRDLDAKLSCIAGIGSEAWTPLGLPGRPRELHPFVEVAGTPHTAVATPGDLLFHIRSNRQDLCFELERILLDALAGAVRVVDEVQGFRYFDSRDLLGFVDGTENPTGAALHGSALVGEDDPDFAGGSYVVVQKYLHTISDWRLLPTEAQEAIIGRTKADNIELDDGPRKSHKALNTIVDAAGNEHDILRDNMPFGRPGHGEFGTYFIGYSRELWVIETMIRNMFVGDPAGDYDRILDYSQAVTGVVFFAPSNTLLESLGD